MRIRQLALKQLDNVLKKWKVASPIIPNHGWIKTIRKALGMTAAQLACRLNVSRPRIVAIENAEQAGAITLRSLKEAANALNCDLVYVFVPRTSLQETLRNQALKQAKKHLKPIAYSMQLEDQAVSKAEMEEELKELADSFLSDSMRHLWDEEK